MDLPCGRVNLDGEDRDEAVDANDVVNKLCQRAENYNDDEDLLSEDENGDNVGHDSEDGDNEGDDGDNDENLLSV